MKGMKDTYERPKPVSMNQELDLEIVSKGSKGDGVAKYKGFTIFVPDSEVGDTVHVRVHKITNTCAFAEQVN